jgi:hypothetical protein
MAANQDLGKFDDGRQSRDSRRQEDGVLQHIFAAQRSLEKVAKKTKGSKTQANDEIYHLIHVDIHPSQSSAILALPTALGLEIACKKESIET